MNKLLNEGMTRNEAVGYINECTNTYSDKIYKYLLEIQEESGDDLAALIHRNPSLLQGSSMRCRLKFKTDPKDSTIGLPLLMTGPQNADFDGDEDNVTVGLDKKMARLWNTMDMCHSYLDMFSPFSSSGLVTHSKPLTASISKFLEG
jgi:DNA-directed RNA polymerase beta' subunit